MKSNYEYKLSCCNVCAITARELIIAGKFKAAASSLNLEVRRRKESIRKLEELIVELSSLEDLP